MYVALIVACGLVIVLAIATIEAVRRMDRTTMELARVKHARDEYVWRNMGLTNQVEQLKAELQKLKTGTSAAAQKRESVEQLLDEGDQRFLVGSEKLVDKDGFAGTVLEFKPTQVM